MKVIIDKNIPFISGMIEPYAEVEYLSDELINAERVKGADALIIRTTVKCDEQLLAGSKVRFIATATIGTDHIDVDYCSKHDIHVVSAPGCNAQAVCDYVSEAIDELERTGREIKTIGVVGVGHVGELVAKMAERRGKRVVLNDPPKGIGVRLDELLQQSDVVSFHTPLTYSGEFSTYHLCGAEQLALCRPDTVIINAARGGIVDEEALVESGLPCVIDCWEGEPQINKKLLESSQTKLASFHIAGYSIEGKRNASEQCIRAFYEYFGLSSCKCTKNVVSLQSDSVNAEKGDSASGWLRRVTEQLKAAPDNYSKLRKQYKLR